ncbi:Napsin-A [Manis pentadactyla]|nr:Napsin-A [Manis pentadactyla]
MNSFSIDAMEKEQRPESQSHFEDSLGEASVWDLDLFLEDSYSQLFFFCTQMFAGPLHSIQFSRYLLSILKLWLDPEE